MLENKEEQEDSGYKSRSIPTYLAVSGVLVVGALVLYPKIKESLLVGQFSLGSLVPWIGLTVFLILVAAVVPVILRKRAKKKEQQLAMLREQLKYKAEQEQATYENWSEYNLTPPTDKEPSPMYRTLTDNTADPYAAKPRGYAETQAKLGYPKDKALAPLKGPEELFLEEAAKESYEELDEFSNVMRANGVTCSEKEMVQKFQDYQKYQLMQATVLAQSSQKKI